MLRCLLSKKLKEKPAPVFAGINRPMSMEDRRLQRKPGNPFKKYPFHSQHRWNLDKKMQLVTSPEKIEYEENGSLGKFELSYNPEINNLNAINQCKRIIEKFLPGSVVLCEPNSNVSTVSMVRLNDERTIFAVNKYSQEVEKAKELRVGALLDFETENEIIDPENLQDLIRACRFY
jgi:hypothetical protein